jgi:hypothetical protein
MDRLWTRGSGWDPHARDPKSGAYGIPQSLPPSKMAAAGPDWQTNPATQLRWELGYIRDRYESIANAWGPEQRFGWYRGGGLRRRLRRGRLATEIRDRRALPDLQGRRPIC